MRIHIWVRNTRKHVFFFQKTLLKKLIYEGYVHVPTKILFESQLLGAESCFLRKIKNCCQRDIAPTENSKKRKKQEVVIFSSLVLRPKMRENPRRNRFFVFVCFFDLRATSSGSNTFFTQKNMVSPRVFTRRTYRGGVLFSCHMRIHELLQYNSFLAGVP